MYKVFSIDCMFSDYGILYCLAGAKDIDDLTEHLGEIMEGRLTKRQIKKLISQKDFRINCVEHMFTDLPYKVLDSYGYLE